MEYGFRILRLFIFVNLNLNKIMLDTTYEIEFCIYVHFDCNCKSLNTPCLELFHSVQGNNNNMSSSHEKINQENNISSSQENHHQEKNISSSQEKIKQFNNDNQNYNTKKKTKIDVDNFQNYLKKVKKIEQPIENIDPLELSKLLCLYLMDSKKSNGEDYEPDTLSSRLHSIKRYLIERSYPKDIMNDPVFSEIHQTLKTKRKVLKALGKGNRPNKSEEITTDDLKKLKDDNLIGVTSGRQLQALVFINNSRFLGTRGQQEHVQLKWGDIQLKVCDSGNEYLQFSERLTKTRQGTSNECRKFPPKIFCLCGKEDNDPTGICPVEAYKIFEEHRPDCQKMPDSNFYLAEIDSPKSKLWYKNQNLGINKIASIMKQLCSIGNIQGRKTNHGLRRHTIRQLKRAKVDSLNIIQLTGHRNLQSLNEYDDCDLDMQKEMSNAISAKKTKR